MCALWFPFLLNYMCGEVSFFLFLFLTNMCALGSIVELGLKKIAKAIDDRVCLIASNNNKKYSIIRNNNKRAEHATRVGAI